ncbi:MAG: hypothetical protein O2973_10720 [Gemmatimonadetes bacterium]|nr:hypothetical protein [Gemmatimonadota bacterium]
MRVERGSVVLVDTNVILESHRVKIWNHLTAYFSFETDSECVVECRTGNQTRDVPIPIDIDALQSDVAVHDLASTDLMDFRLRLGAEPSLDPCEERLVAAALIRQDVWLLCSPDKAAVRACHMLGLLDRIVALEDLTIAAGIRARLWDNFTCDWLSNFRTNLLLDL